jgi:hypothetical protein
MGTLVLAGLALVAGWKIRGWVERIPQGIEHRAGMHFVRPGPGAITEAYQLGRGDERAERIYEHAESRGPTTLHRGVS